MIARLLATATLAASCLLGQTQVCTVTNAGPGCGPVLQVVFTPLGGDHHRVQMNGSGFFPQSLGAFVWGLNPISVPLFPNSTCLIQTDYLWGHSFMSDTAGNWSWGRAWPRWYESFFRMQAATLLVEPNGSVDVKLTNCEVAACSLQ